VVSTTILATAYVVRRIASIPWTVIPSLDAPRVLSDGEPMERAIPADKVASAPESLFFTSFAGDVGAGAGIFARALDLRRWCITEVDGKSIGDVTVTEPSDHIET
jgi:hypothetical protein